MEGRGASTATAASLSEAIDCLDQSRPDVILLDLRLPDAEGLSGLRSLLEKRPDAKIVIMTAFGSIEMAVEAIRSGAEDFVTKPVAAEHLNHV
ncbi:MAG: response regulator, partial [Thermoanaerobaculia bacterium]